jgi:hypothetical protein
MPGSGVRVPHNPLMGVIGLGDSLATKGFI